VVFEEDYVELTCAPLEVLKKIFDDIDSMKHLEPIYTASASYFKSTKAQADKACNEEADFFLDSHDSLTFKVDSVVTEALQEQTVSFDKKDLFSRIIANQVDKS